MMISRYIPTVKGGSQDAGRKYANTFLTQIKRNLKWLVNNDDVKPDLTDKFIKSVKYQEKYILREWPWILEEIHSIADTLDIDYYDLLLLNLRAWWGTNKEFKGISKKDRNGSCSHFIIRLKDESLGCVGVLDDGVDLYCGPVRYIPEIGNSFVTFPITGTSWGNDGMNDKGLVVTLSSLPLNGDEYLKDSISRDIAIRALLQTCSNINDVKHFCSDHPFSINLICADANGDFFAAHKTPRKCYEISMNNRYIAMANHIYDDTAAFEIYESTKAEFSENMTSRLRRGRIVSFLQKHADQCGMEDIIEFVKVYYPGDMSSINNNLTAYITYFNPIRDNKAFLLQCPKETNNESKISKCPIGVETC